MRVRLGGPSEDLRAILAFALFALLAVAIPLLVAWFAPADGRTTEALVIWLIIAYSAARLSLLALRGEMRLLSLTFWIFVYVWLGVAPFVQLIHSEFPLPGYYPPSMIIFCVAVIGFGLAAFEFGMYIANNLQARPGGERLFLRRRLSFSRIIILAVLAVLVSSYLVWRLGGPLVFMASRRDVFLFLSNITGAETPEMLQLLFKALRVPPFVALFLLWWTWTRQRASLGNYQNLCLLALLGATGLINILVNNPVNSARYWFGTIAMSLTFISIPWRKNWSFAFWTVLLIGALIVVFPYADIFRRDVDMGNLYFEGLDPVVDQGNYDAFQQAMNAITFVDEEGPRYGRQMTATVLFWVPRRIWNDKPYPSGRLVAEHLGYRATNLSMPLWGEAYLDGGLIFTGIVFMVYGGFLGTVERRFVDHLSHRRRAPELYGIMVPVLAAYQLFLLRGALMNCVAYLFPVVLLLVLVSKRSEQVSERPD